MIPKFEQHVNDHIIPYNIPEKIHKSENSSPKLKQENKIPENKIGRLSNITKFKTIPIAREDSDITFELEKNKELHSIKGVFRSGDIDKITAFLKEEEADNFTFNKEISRIKKEYQKELADATFLTKKDWKILAGIELCDKKTFEHSVGTYMVAKKKIEERLIDLGLEVTHEGVTLEQLYRACLFHDIGKLAIPNFILNNETTDSQWVFHFMELPEDEQDEILVENKLIIPDNIRHDLGKMTEFFSKNRIRAVNLVPIGSILSEEQKVELKKIKLPDEPKLEEELGPEEKKKEQDIAQLPLKKILQLHEKKSEDILIELGYVIEALLAGNHHNYKYKNKKKGEKPASLSTLHISIELASNIIHFADIQNALNGERSYHHKQPMLRIMAFLVDHATSGVTDPILTARWIDDELKKMSPEYLDEIRNMTAKHQHHNYLQQRNEELLLIDDFLSDYLPENYRQTEEEKEREQLAA